MMTGRVFETLVGAVVVAAAVIFVVFAYDKAGVADTSGVTFHAEFDTVGSLQRGDDVRIAGIRVGTVTSMELDPEWYLARVTMDIEPGIGLTEDTIVTVASSGLLGGNYISMLPGAGAAASDGYLFTDTHGAVDLIDAVSRSMFGGLEE